MIKVASNAFLATKISFINEIANVCEETGADVIQVAEGMGLDKRIGRHFLRAGIGFGGSCFGKDVSALKQLAGNSGYHFQILNSVMEVNELQKRRLVQKLIKHLGPLRGKTIALLGLAFKPGTDDMRDSPLVLLAERLIGKGYDISIYDTSVKMSRLLGKNREFIDREIPHLERLLRDQPEHALEGAEVIVVGHAEPAALRTIAEQAGRRRVIDLAGYRDLQNALADGGYEGICW
jgi:UDPglucose 6-dehydrogenase